MNRDDKVKMLVLWAELHEQMKKMQNFIDRYDAEKFDGELGKSVAQQVQETVAGFLKLYEDVDKICTEEFGI